MAQRSQIDPDAAPWWEGIERGELRYQLCRGCNRPVFYPRSICPHCFSTRLEWRTSGGRGEVYAFTVVRRPPEPAFASRVPYVVALVELEERFRMMTNVVDCPVDRVHVGMKVQVVFGEGVDGRRLPYFRPAAGGD